MKIFQLAIGFMFLLFAFDSLSLAQKNNCDCNLASEKDVPLGGNMVITENAGKIKQIKGLITYGSNEQRFEDVVVEVFEVTKEEKQNIKENAWRIADKKPRKIACITGKTGQFCFKNLLKGVYVLRIGTRTRLVEYFNYFFVIVELDTKEGKNKDIKVVLELAT
ncbi:MAG TPA: hypothetical protein PKY82_24050 [Pyrinomonadaceae bacterium]|nr:hypothetical protein [Pyrinomonadaceae bacterium]